MPSPLKQPWLLIRLVCNSVSIDYNEGRIKSGAMVINYCWSSVESPWKRGGGGGHMGSNADRNKGLPRGSAPPTVRD